MLFYNKEYAGLNDALNKDPRYVVAIDFDGGDLFYFTSHSDTALPGGLSASEYAHSTLKVRSLSSQTLSPNDARATVGSMSFDLLNVDGAVNTLFKTKLEAGKGLRKTIAKLYKGYDGLTDFDTQFELIGTQIVDDAVTFHRKENYYTIKCLDPQRLLKEDIFDLASTNITATVAIDDTTINVGDTTDFEMFEHDAGYDDAASSTVGYLKLHYNSDEFEIVRYTGKTSTSFTGVTRGVFGSKALIHEYTTGDEADRQIEVEEYVYLEGPIFKIAYAILTGSLYGQSGKTLPSGWHLGIDTTYIGTGSFTGIGNDIWDTSDPTLGFQCRFQGIDKTNGKTFFEKELMLLAGCFHTVSDDGQIVVRRMANASPDAATLGTLDESFITSASSLTHDLGDVANVYYIEWNWEDLLGQYTRVTALGDAESASVHEGGATKGYTFRGMYGNRMTDDRIYQRFDALRSMYSGPPLRMSVTAHGRADAYEVGDTIRIQLDTMADFTNGSQTTLDRAFQIHGKRLNAKNGEVTYTLFGSSQEAGTLQPPSIEGLSSVLPDSFYSSGLNSANNIETMALAIDPVSGFTVTGGVGYLNVDITCTGVAGNVNHVNSIFWYDGDMEISSGVTITVENNAQFRIQGFFENKGTITGKGNGLTGGTGYTTGIFGAYGNAGAAGLIGTTRGAGGIFGSGLSIISETAEGLNAAIPEINAEYNGSTLTGIPDDIRGTSGGAGGPIYNYSSPPDYIAGGDGGEGGAGVVVVSRGFSNSLATGSMDFSGNDGSLGSYVPSLLTNYYSGSGGGGSPGAIIFIMDGGSNSVTGTSVITADRGACTIQGTPNDVPLKYDSFSDPAYSYYVGLGSESMNTAAVRITYVTGTQSPQEDIPQSTSDDTAPTLAELTNTPRSVAGNLSTIEITANDAGDSNYSYSNAYIRIKNTDIWTKVDIPASPEATYVVSSDGTTYEVHTRSVSTKGIESKHGAIAEITVSNVISPDISDATPTGFDKLTIPDVHGLELFEQGNGTEFTGKDAKFTWRKTAASDFYEIGQEPTGLGADAGTLDQYFQDYWVRVYNGSTLLREEFVTDNWYTYTYEKNAEDYSRINGSAGAYRTFTAVVVVRVTYTSAVSDVPAKLTVTNPAPTAPGGLSLRAIFKTLILEFTLPDDLDFKGTLIWLGTSSGFTRNAASLVTPETGITGNKLIINSLPNGNPLSSNTTYYVVLQTFDEFGLDGTESVELSATTLQVDGEFDIESQSIKTAQIGLAQITNALVNDMAVDKLTSGDFTGKYINITSGGNIRSGQTAYNTGTGFWLGDVSGTPKFSIGNPAGNYMLWDGSSLTINGSMSVSSLTSGDFAGKYINITTGGNIRSGQTAYDTGTGFWLGDDSGTPKFSIGNSAGNKMTWNGTTLTVDGTLAAATGTFSGVLTASAVDAVDTINIVDEATAITAFAYTAGSAGITGTITLQSVTITTTGDPINIYASTIITGTGLVDITLVRGSTTIYTATNIAPGPMAFNMSTTTTAGSVTFYLRATLVSGSPSATNRSLIVNEIKK